MQLDSCTRDPSCWASPVATPLHAQRPLTTFQSASKAPKDPRIQYLATPQIWEEKLQFTWGRPSSQTILPLKLPAISRTKNPINRDPRCPASRGAFPACRLSAAGRASHSGVHSMPTCQLDIVQCLQKCKLITTHSFVSSVTTSRCSSHRPEPKDLPKHSSNPKIRHLQNPRYVFGVSNGTLSKASSAAWLLSSERSFLADSYLGVKPVM